MRMPNRSVSYKCTFLIIVGCDLINHTSINNQLKRNFHTNIWAHRSHAKINISTIATKHSSSPHLAPPTFHIWSINEYIFQSTIAMPAYKQYCSSIHNVWSQWQEAVNPLTLSSEAAWRSVVVWRSSGRAGSHAGCLETHREQQHQYSNLIG